jgi:hypothetical protein
MLELAVADGRKRQVTEGSASFPALEARLGQNTLRPCSRIEVRQRCEPFDPGEPVPLLPPPLGIQEVVRERRRVGLREAELP